MQPANSKWFPQLGALIYNKYITLQSPTSGRYQGWRSCVLSGFIATLGGMVARDNWKSMKTEYTPLKALRKSWEPNPSTKGN